MGQMNNKKQWKEGEIQRDNCIFAKYYIVTFSKNTLSPIHHIKMMNF